MPERRNPLAPPQPLDGPGPTPADVQLCARLATANLTLDEVRDCCRDVLTRVGDGQVSWFDLLVALRTVAALVSD